MRKVSYTERPQTIKDKVLNALYNTFSNIGLSSLADMFKTIVVLSTSATVLDWSAGKIFTQTLTAAKTWSDSNLHIGTKDIEVIGAFDLNVPSYWKPLDGSSDYDGSVLNFIQIKCTNSSATPTVWYFISKEAS